MTPATPAAPATAATAAPATQSTVARVPSRSRPRLQNIDDPFQALDIYHLKKGVGDTIEIKARNVSRRGLLVKSVELYAESNDRVPLDNIGFWLPAGDVVVATRDVPELSRRLGEDEPIKAVINDAEFRDTPPAELADRPSGTSTRGDAGTR